jgi:peptidoglycan/LPS O-acetylase OafA/YrhL
MGFRATPWMQIYTSRVFRILPLVLFSFTVISGVVVWRTGRSPDGEFLKTAVQWVTGWDEPPLLGLADSGRINAYVLWSLWMEWLFYLVALPVCAAAMDVVRGRLPSFVLPVGFAGVGLGMRFFHIGGEMPKYMHLFALGMLAYEAQRHEAVIRVMRGRIAAVIAVAILGAAMSSVRVPYGFLQSGFYGVFFVCVACGNDIFGVLRTKGAQVLGECSFGIYLLHGVVLSLLFVEGESLLRHLSSSVLPTLLPMVFVGVVGVAGITFLLIEGPAIRFGKKLVRWRGRLLRMA